MLVNLYNPNTRQAKQAKVGFSWTVFFFGPFPALFRGDWKWFLIILLANSFTAGFSNLVFIFIYNKLYINDLLLQGFEPNDQSNYQILLSKGFFVPRYSEETVVDDFDFDDLDF